MKGNYILQINLSEDKEIRVGKLGNIYFKKGFYAYIGSAMNSLEGRINRHLRFDKKFHWHIDYLLKHAEISKVFYKQINERIECKVAETFNKKLESIKHFGCSDCSCKSHLFYGSQEEIENTSNNLGFNIKNIQNP